MERIDEIDGGSSGDDDDDGAQRTYVNWAVAVEPKSLIGTGSRATTPATHRRNVGWLRLWWHSSFCRIGLFEGAIAEMLAAVAVAWCRGSQPTRKCFRQNYYDCCRLSLFTLHIASARVVLLAASYEPATSLHQFSTTSIEEKACPRPPPSLTVVEENSLSDPVRGNDTSCCWSMLHLCPHPVGHISRTPFPLCPPNHWRAWSRWPPWPHPGHHTYTPLTGSWQRKQNPTLRRQDLQVRRAAAPSSVALGAGRGFPHLGHDSWIVVDC